MMDIISVFEFVIQAGLGKFAFLVIFFNAPSIITCFYFYEKMKANYLSKAEHDKIREHEYALLLKPLKEEIEKLVTALQDIDKKLGIHEERFSHIRHV